MAWVAQGGQSVGKTSKGRRGGGGGGSSVSEDESGGKPRTFQGVPLCRETMCPGLPRKPLPQPGINCVNRDNPCLPCDIINLPLRSSVTGVQVKQAVADAQKRYFCSVWNLLFSHLFPDHVFHSCRNLQSSYTQPECRKAPAIREKTPPLPLLPYGASPGNVINPPPDLKMRIRRPTIKKSPKRVKKGKSPPTPTEAKKEKVFLPVHIQSPKRETKAQIPTTQLPKMPRLPRGGRGGLRYNIWTMPMPDASKGTYKAKKPYGS